MSKIVRASRSPKSVFLGVTESAQDPDPVAQSRTRKDIPPPAKSDCDSHPAGLLVVGFVLPSIASDALSNVGTTDPGTVEDIPSVRAAAP